MLMRPLLAFLLATASLILPLATLSPAPVQAATANVRIVAVTDAAGAIVGELTGDWPPEGVAAFETAARIILRRTGGPVPISVRATWQNLGEDTLGLGGSTQLLLDVPGGKPGVYYPQALANQVAGARLLDGPDIEIDLNATADWDYRLDGRVADEKDGSLVQTIVHEIVHGMGILGTAWWDDGEGWLGDEDGIAAPPRRAGWHRHGGALHWHAAPRRALAVDPAPDIYDTFVVTGRGRAITSFTSPSDALGRALVSDDLFFDGPRARAANGGRPVKLYAPLDWIEGSSYAHLDDDTYGDGPDALLTAVGEKAQSAELGPRTLGILADLGWTVLRN
jgi:hypothetical protein